MKKRCICIMALLALLVGILPALAGPPSLSVNEQFKILQDYLAGDESVTVAQAQSAVRMLRALMETQPEALTKARAGHLTDTDGEVTYVLNVHSNRFHRLTCPGVKNMAEKNRLDYHGTREMLIAAGFIACGHCKP